MKKKLKFTKKWAETTSSGKEFHLKITWTEKNLFVSSVLQREKNFFTCTSNTSSTENISQVPRHVIYNLPNNY